MRLKDDAAHSSSQAPPLQHRTDTAWGSLCAVLGSKTEGYEVLSRAVQFLKEKRSSVVSIQKHKHTDLEAQIVSATKGLIILVRKN